MNIPYQAANKGVISIVVPVYNEEAGIATFIKAIKTIESQCAYVFDIIFIDDGSVDKTPDILEQLCLQEPRIKCISLSRNFGKDNALSAGLAYTRGDAVVVMDVDLQDPPELILDFIKQWERGYEVVYGIRQNRDSDSFLKKLTSYGFYRVFNIISDQKIPKDVGDYRLMDRKVIQALLQLTEKERFMKGLFAWVGYKQTGVEYVREKRHEGTTKWNYFKLLNFAVDGIIGFSNAPLRLITLGGLITSSLAFCYLLFIIARVMIFGIDVPGYASLLAVVLFFGSVQIMVLGLIGEYIRRIFTESKRRPAFIVAKTTNLEEEMVQAEAVNAVG